MRSVEKALDFLGEKPVVTRKREEILGADRIILPGVGSFGDAMHNLEAFGLTEVIKEAVEKKIPLLGICLGMQVLFEKSEESPGVKGLGILEGEIVRFPKTEGLKIPHMGWNSLSCSKDGRLFEGLEENPYVYFVHSYYLKAERSKDRKSNCRIWSDDSCLGGEGQRLRMPVPPGKERRDRASYSEKFHRKTGGVADVYEENYSLSGCE